MNGMPDRSAAGLMADVPAGARVCAAHQPNLLPWAGWLAKMARADVFVIADSVQYVKENFVNRCKLPTGEAFTWVTIPVERRGRFGQLIRDVRVDDTQNWRKKAIRTFRHRYGKSPAFAEAGQRIGRVIEERRCFLLDINLALLEVVRETLGLKTPIRLLSELGLVTDDRCERLAAMTRAVGCTHYLSGRGGSSRYLESGSFEKARISYSFFGYREPPYPQGADVFVPGCSIVDSLFRIGPGATLKRIGRNASTNRP